MIAPETAMPLADNANPDHASWRDHYERWRRSDLSKGAFCRENALNAGRFYYYCRVFSAEEPGTAPVAERCAPALTSFVPLAITQVPEPEPALRVQIADVTLSCASAVSAEQLKQWLQAIRSTL